MTELAKKAPQYIPVSEIADMALNYKWDSESPFSLINQASDSEIRTLEKLSNRGLIAYAIACAEWVVYRISGVIGDLLPYYYFEAFWAYVMGHQNLFEYPPELDHEEWGDYERGPIDCAISSVMNVIYLSEYYNPPVNEAARIAELAKHVLPNEHYFIDWQKIILDRLFKNCQRDDEYPEGEPIPRQIMDVSIEYEKRQIEKLVEINYEGQDFSQNPFFVKNT